MFNAPLASKSHPHHTTPVSLTPEVSVGGQTLVMIGGPCTVESLDQIETIVDRLYPQTIHGLRGGVFKPRTSPYSFQGLGREGVDILRHIKRKQGIPLVTEVMAVDQIAELADTVDMLQIGSRNMHNFDLLKALGQVKKPILLKRGLAATLEEFIFAAEYILSYGNSQVVLCERGIRSFDPYTRNVLDLGAVVALKQLTHLPVIVDPSHAVGKWELVSGVAKAAIAAGADGLMIECHPEPEKSVSDARQALSLAGMEKLVTELAPIATAVGRKLVSPHLLPKVA